MEPGLSRRELLARAAVAVPVLAGASRLAPPAAAQTPGPIVKPLPPEWFTPHRDERRDALGRGARARLPRAQRALLRPQPHGDAGDRPAHAGTCACTGAACDARRLDLSYRELRRLPSRTLTAAIECAGNGRSFFGSQQGTPAAGSAWKLGAIGVARWRGVPLRALLERAGVTRHAVDVLPAGPRRGGRRRRARAPAAADRQGARRRARRPRDERRAAAARPRLPGPARRAGLGRDRQHQVARRPRGRRPPARSRRGARRPTGWSAPPTRPTRRR